MPAAAMTAKTAMLTLRILSSSVWAVVPRTDHRRGPRHLQRVT